MDLTLKRNQYLPAGIFGTITQDVDGEGVFATLEHAYPPSNGTEYSAKIPVGVYQCLRGEHELSNGKPFETFEVMGVEGHTGLLFHKGNFDSDSSGCILLGIDVDGTMITQSGFAFQKFMDMQDGEDFFQLTVIA